MRVPGVLRRTVSCAAETSAATNKHALAVTVTTAMSIMMAMNVLDHL